jgi:hypothetical protein
MKINLIHAGCSFSLIGFGSIILFSAPIASAQSGSEPIGTFSFLGQKNTEVTYENPLNVGPVACVPTAVANGLYYLEHNAAMEDKPDPFTADPGTYLAVNQLAQVMGTTHSVFNNPNPPPPRITSGGTTIVGSALGLMKYLSPQGQNPAPTISVTGQYSAAADSWLGDGFGEPSFANNFTKTTPTAGYLAAALNDNDGVEIGIQFGNFGGNSALNFNPTGGHEMTLYGIDFNPKTEKGTIDFLDPFGTSAYTAEGKLTLTDGFLYVQYDTEGGQTVFGRIVDDMVEKVNVPDRASTSCLLAGSLMILGAVGRGRWRTR